MDGYSNRDLLVNAVTNNTYDLEKVHETLVEIVRESYHHLALTQKTSVGLNRFNYKSTDLIVENGDIHIVVDKELIEQYSRRLYKTSDFYGKTMSIADILSNRKIFVKLPILFIDGLITFNYKIKVYSDKTELILDYNKDLIEGRHTYTVMYIYNEGLTTVKLNKFLIDKYGYNIPKRLLIDLPKVKKYCKLYGFVDDISTLQASSAFNVSISDTSIDIEPHDYAKQIIYEAREFYLHLLNIRHYHEIDREYTIKKRLSTNEDKVELCVIDNYPMTIPAENIVVYKYNTILNAYLVDNNCSVIHHYPYIYEIVDTKMSVGDKYKIGYFYAESLDDYAYTNLIYPYLKLLKGKLEKTNMEDAINAAYFMDYSDEYYLQLFDKYFSFEEYLYRYNMNDYEDQGKRPDHADYKIDTMWSFLRHNPEHLRHYVNNQNDCGTNFYAFVSNIDLDERRRIDTSQEENDYIELPEECYVFKFNREKNEFIKLRFFVDGLHVIPVYHTEYGDFDYIYLPVNKINPDSFIEIEKFESYVFSQDLTLNILDVPKEIMLTDYSDLNFKPTLKDIYFIHAKTGTFLSNDRFEILAEIDGIITPINIYEYTFLDKFYIRLKDESLNNVKITLKIGKTEELIHDIFDTSTVCTALLSASFKCIKNYIRVFYNGRLLPYDYWKLLNPGNGDRPYVITKFRPNETAEVIFDVTPYHYECKYSVKEVNNYGVIDLSGLIDKPFDLLYYDMYLNGRKLSMANIVYISPTKIKLINVDSKWNFQIYKKDRDIEYFSMDLIKDMFTLPIDELLDDDKLTDEEKRIIVDGIVEENTPDGVNPGTTEDEPDFLDFDVTDNDEFDLLTFLQNEYYPVGHINPDELQFNNMRIQNYEYVYSMMTNDGRASQNNVVRLNPDEAFAASTVIRVSSDIE